MERAQGGHEVDGDGEPASRRPVRRTRGVTVERRLAMKSVTAGIEAAWSGPGAQGATFSVATPLTVEDQAEHRWYLEEWLRWRGQGAAARAKAFEGRLEEIGRTLHRALRGDEDVHPLADLAREVLDPAGHEARSGGLSGGGAGGDTRHKLFTIASTDAAALSLPWELVHDGRSPLLLRDVILRRQLLTTSTPVRAAVTLPLRILWIVSRPSDVGFIDPRSSLRPGLDALAALGGLVEVELCVPPTLAEVERQLDAARREGRPFHLVHFDGHGVYLQQSGVGALCFEEADAKGKTDAKNDLVEGARFGDLLARHHVPVALLEACQTADLSTSVFGSVAPALLRAGVGSVIAFSHAVTVTGARVFVRALYEALCQGDTIGEALGAARRAMRADPVRHTWRSGETTSLLDWHIAQLYQAGDDPVLVPGGGLTRRATPRKTGPLAGEGFRIEPMYGFRGRARELLTLERRLRAHVAVLVKGMGGMGKTSLALEAGRWWTRTGQRGDGAVFTSFEARPSVEQVVRSIGVAFEGQDFLQKSEEQQRERAIELFRTKEVLWIWDNFESMLPQYQEPEGELGEESAATMGTPGTTSAQGTSGAAGATGVSGAVSAGVGAGAGARVAPFEGVTDEERRRVAALFRALVGKASGAPKGWLVVTCRPGESGLSPIADMDLPGLSPPDALELTQEILSYKGVACDRPGYEREAIDALLAALDHHPLSIELVVPHLRASRPADVQRDFRERLDRFTNPGAPEDRNRSLRASLAFSADRLGPEVKAVLPYLAWFEGGAFEQVILDFTQWTPEKWGRARAGLESVALVRAEEDAVLFADRPFLVFHPTLPYAARAEEVPDRDAAEARWVAVYAGLAESAYQALFGPNPAGGMAVVAREERNLRRAAARAFGSGRFEEAGVLTAVVGSYLESMGRPREQGRWAAWAQRQMAAAPAGAARWAREREHAWGLFLEGRLGDAVKLLEAQLMAIDAAGGDVQQRALCNRRLGELWVNAREPGRSLAPLQEAIDGFEACGDEANLSAALGDQANAFRALGRLSEALATAERGVAINRKLGNTRDEAVGLGRTAEILTDMHRFTEAEATYQEALATARRAGVPGLEGTTFQHLGSLAVDQGKFATAVEHYHRALERFQAMADKPSEMRTAGLLGTAEQQLGHFEAAAAWYDQAEALATALGDEAQLGVTAQNRGILFQTQALALPEGPERRRLLEQAVSSIERSLILKRKRQDTVGVAPSLCQLGILHRYLRQLDAAEKHAREALAIREALGLPDVYKDYASLEAIATARQDEAQAAVWRAKKEAKKAELRKLAGPPRLPPAFLEAVTALCQAIYFARSVGAPLPLPATEGIATLSSNAEPIGAAGRFLHAVAQAETPLPALPGDLPAELRDLLQQLVAALPPST